MARRLVIAVAAGLALWGAVTRYGRIILDAEAANIAYTLSKLGFTVARIGNTVYVEGQEGAAGFSIEWHCSGLVLYTVFLAILAFTGRGELTSILRWSILGFLVIYGANILRMIAILLIYTGYGVERAMLFHTWIAPALMVGLLVILTDKLVRGGAK